METQVYSVKKMIWTNILFFAVTTAVALIGGPVYYAKCGISAPELMLFLFYMTATGLSITAGYHRLFSHVTYRANPVIRFLFLFFGAAAFEQSALAWSAQHRDHHRYVDTDRDPYSIQKGFFYAHIGWLIFWKHKIDYDNVNDLQKDAMVMHQHRYYILWAAVSGIVLPVAAGALSGHALGAFIFAVCLRLTLVYHSTFFINSVCHMFGKATYDVYATARDHWLVALLTFGEGYHNFHHRFPSDYRNGVRWFDWDPSKWLIRLMGFLKMASDLKRVSNFKILAARLAGENCRFSDILIKHESSEAVAAAVKALTARYAEVKSTLVRWETAALEYHELLQTKMAEHSQHLKKAGLEKIDAARREFRQAYMTWAELTSLKPSRLLQLSA
ncbi:MAG: hypothetical protein A2Z83_03855 [Omnitrophica bacterium GWA2_52_8]|nr:MAG: hypothetical protein A2Z83_03855 [Omnitrophica bacterium GWA2_52_8]